MLVIARTIVTAVAMSALAVTIAPPVSARVAPPAPVRIVVTGPVTTVPLELVSDRPTTARGGHGAVVSRPTTTGAVTDHEVWSDWSRISARLAVRSADLRIGRQDWEAEDLGDATVTRFPVTVLRASRVTSGRPVALGRGRVAGLVTVTHYDPSTGAYRPSQVSPVMVQSLTGGRWVTVATWTTAADGVAAGVVTVPVGARQLRYVRPDGATVAAAMSAPVIVRVA